MTLLPAELLLVAAEIARALPGRPLQKVVSVGAHAIALGFSGAWLLVSIDRRFGRVHLLEAKPAGTGEAATPFVMQLRKELVALRFESVEAVAGERALALEFARDRVRRRLLVFLYGNGPRLVLLDEEGGVVGAFPPPSTDATAPIPVALPPPRADARPSRFEGAAVSAQIAARYAEEEAGAGAGAVRVTAAADARRAIDKLRRKEEALGADLARLEAATTRRRHADLLLAHLADVPRGADAVTLPDDFADGAPLVIALDPARSASDNAARMYREYRRLARGHAAATARLAQVRADRAGAEARLAAIESADDSTLAGLVLRSSSPWPATRGAPPAAPRPRTRTPARALPYRSYRSASGTSILVGKGADKNDALTFRVARGGDLWLHTRDLPGAHVVVPLAGRPVDEATLLDAATLALWFSPARPGDPLSDNAARKVQADITYAPRSLVRKPKGAAPGRVSIAGGKTIRIRLEPERLRRLLATREA